MKPSLALELLTSDHFECGKLRKIFPNPYTPNLFTPRYESFLTSVEAVLLLFRLLLGGCRSIRDLDIGEIVLSDCAEGVCIWKVELKSVTRS